MSGENNDISVVVPDVTNRETRTFRVSIIALLIFVSGYIVLWSDRHNDARYVQIGGVPDGRYVQEAAYLSDRQADALLLAAREKDLTDKLDNHEKWMEAISRQLGEVLNRNGGTIGQGRGGYVQGSEYPGYPGAQPAQGDKQ